MVAGAGDPQPSPNTFIHGESPATGAAWNNQATIAFDKLKVTNNRSSSSSNNNNNTSSTVVTAGPSGQICLHSMHKYTPRIHVQEVKECELPDEVKMSRKPDQEQPQLQEGVGGSTSSSSQGGDPSVLGAAEQGSTIGSGTTNIIKEIKLERPFNVC